MNWDKCYWSKNLHRPWLLLIPAATVAYLSMLEAFLNKLLSYLRSNRFHWSRGDFVTTHRLSCISSEVHLRNSQINTERLWDCQRHPGSDDVRTGLTREPDIPQPPPAWQVWHHLLQEQPCRKPKSKKLPLGPSQSAKIPVTSFSGHPLSQLLLTGWAYVVTNVCAVQGRIATYSRVCETTLMPEAQLN